MKRPELHIWGFKIIFGGKHLFVLEEENPLSPRNNIEAYLQQRFVAAQVLLFR